MSPKLIAVLGGLVVIALVMVGVARLTGGDEDGTLALGETAVVEYRQATSAGGPRPATTLAVTVTAVRHGSQDDLARGGFEVEPEDRSATPFYVDARFENRGETPLEQNLDVSLEDDDGESLPRTLILDLGEGTFEPCPNVTEGTLEPGGSYESCTLVLVPDGSEVDKVLFVSQQPDNEIVFTPWDASAS